MHVAVDNRGQSSFPTSASKGLEHNGAGKGRGFNINIPWGSQNVGNQAYIEATLQVILPALRRFQPELVSVSLHLCLYKTTHICALFL